MTRLDQSSPDLVDDKYFKLIKAFAFNPFANNNGDCQSGTDGTSTWSDCKSSCDGDNCNTNNLNKRMQCHSCTATRDSLNGTVGIGDDNCFDNAQVRSVIKIIFERRKKNLTLDLILKHIVIFPIFRIPHWFNVQMRVMFAFLNYDSIGAPEVKY